MVSYPAARPAVRTPPFPSRRSRHATHAKASRSVPVFASRCPGSSRRPHSAAPVTSSAPKPRTLSQCSRHDVPARPAARTPPPPSRHSRQSLAPRPSVRATMSRLAPPFALRRPRHAVRAPAACAASRVAHRASPRSPSNRSDPRFSHFSGARNARFFVLRHRSLGLRPNPRQARRGSVSPVGCWTEGPKRPEAGQRNHERDRQGSAND